MRSRNCRCWNRKFNFFVLVLTMSTVFCLKKERLNDYSYNYFGKQNTTINNHQNEENTNRKVTVFNRTNFSRIMVKNKPDPIDKNKKFVKIMKWLRGKIDHQIVDVTRIRNLSDFVDVKKRDIDIAVILRILDSPTPKVKHKVSRAQKKFSTTPMFKELFIGRCYEYQFQNKDFLGSKKWNCNELWDSFFGAFAYKEPCDVTMNDYEKLLNMTEEDVPYNKGLLWSGSRDVAHQLSDFLHTKRFISLEDTLAGYIVNRLSWCGSTIDPGINFNACPWECSIQSPYWSLANQKFARNLRGTVHIILNGTRRHHNDQNIYPAYMKHRYYLGPYVIPELSKRNVEKIIIIVAHSLHTNYLERCGEKSVLQLMRDIEQKKIPVECYNDTNSIKHILCIDQKGDPECSLP